MKKSPVVLAVSFLAALAPLQALDINDENATENYRFSGFPDAPVPNASDDFLAADYDLSGVGWGSSANQSFTMIDNEHFVFATHFPPATSSLFFLQPRTRWRGGVHH